MAEQDFFGFDEDKTSKACNFAVPMDGIPYFDRTADRLNHFAQTKGCSGDLCPRFEYCSEIAKIAVHAVNIRLEIEKNNTSLN